MSSEQMNTNDINSKQPPVEVTNWNRLVHYAQFLCRNTEKNFKICMIDEEHEEVRIESEDEFNTNVKFAREQGLASLSLIVYIDDARMFEGIYYLQKPQERFTMPKPTAFPADKLQNLRQNVLLDKWYIPVKMDEALGTCLTSAIKLAQEGKFDANVDCKEFIETIVPDAFRKLQTTQSVFCWPREVQYGIFEMTELLVDLVGVRIRHTPVPVTLLNALALTLDTGTTFSQKHKDESLPLDRHYKLDDEEFLRINYSNQVETFGWLRSFIQRFIAQGGLKHLQIQFDHVNKSHSATTALEYNSLLKLFAKCHQCINAHRFRLIFTRSIRQAIEYYLQMKKSNNQLNEQLNELNETLIEVCFNYEMNDEVNEILELPAVPNTLETPPLPANIEPVRSSSIEIIDLNKLTISKKPNSQDCYEQLSQDIRALSMTTDDTERKNIKKQRMDEQVTIPLFPRHDRTTDDALSSSEKRSVKRKQRKEQRRLSGKKDSKRSSAITNKAYDRWDPTDVLRFFAPMRRQIANLYDDLQLATSRGNIREVLKIQENLKLLRPYSARFIADENTPDGTNMQFGQVFRKCWILLNDGSMPWSTDDVQLLNLADGITVVEQPLVPVTAPHDRALITVDYICANEVGTYESKWILSYRDQTFGPMIWCSIEVGDHSTVKKPVSEVKETFELLDIPLPACFDLSKPYQSTTSGNNSLRSSFSLSRSNSTDKPSDLVTDTLLDLDSTDDDRLSSVTLPSNSNETSLIELMPILANTHVERQQSLRSNQSLDFVDSVVTNIFSVAKQAGSTAKAIFNTLQAHEETITPVVQREQQEQILINTSNSNDDDDDFFEHIDDNETQTNLTLSNDPMDILIEMGFVNRAKNQRFLAANNNDLNKVIELLTNEEFD